MEIKIIPDVVSFAGRDKISAKVLCPYCGKIHTYYNINKSRLSGIVSLGKMCQSKFTPDDASYNIHPIDKCMPIQYVIYGKLMDLLHKMYLNESEYHSNKVQEITSEYKEEVEDSCEYVAKINQKYCKRYVTVLK